MEPAIKIYSLSEANAMIPEVTEHLKKIFSKKETYAKLHDEVLMHELLTEAEKQAGIDFNEDHLDKDRKNLEEEVTEIGQDILSLIQTGCLIRDLEIGIVEFRGELKGELVYFFWEYGQPSIQFYRNMQDHPKEKRPLPSKPH